MQMNKTDLIKMVAEKANKPTKEVAEIIDSFFKELSQNLREKDTALSFKTTSIILVILRKTIIFAHSDAGSTASGVSFYRSYKIIFVGGNQMRQRSFF